MATAEKTWVDGHEAARILGVPDTRNVERLVQEGLIGVRDLPGTRERFRRQDCVNLARISVRAATAAAS